MSSMTSKGLPGYEARVAAWNCGVYEARTGLPCHPPYLDNEALNVEYRQGYQFVAQRQEIWGRYSESQEQESEERP